MSTGQPDRQGVGIKRSMSEGEWDVLSSTLNLPEACLINRFSNLNADNWFLRIEELYNKVEIHSINTSKGDTADVGIFSDNTKVTVYKFLESRNSLPGLGQIYSESQYLV